MTRGARDEGMSGNSRFGQRRANALDCGFRRVVTNGDVWSNRRGRQLTGIVENDTAVMCDDLVSEGKRWTGITRGKTLPTDQRAHSCGRTQQPRASCPPPRGPLHSPAPVRQTKTAAPDGAAVPIPDFWPL